MGFISFSDTSVPLPESLLSSSKLNVPHDTIFEEPWETYRKTKQMSFLSRKQKKFLVDHSNELFLSILKAMLHEAFFLAICNATNVAFQVAKKIHVYTPFCNCNCCVASCKKCKTNLVFSQRCETSCSRVTSPPQLAGFFIRHRLGCKLQEKLLRVIWPLHRTQIHMPRQVINRWLLL